MFVWKRNVENHNCGEGSRGHRVSWRPVSSRYHKQTFDEINGGFVVSLSDLLGV